MKRFLVISSTTVSAFLGGFTCNYMLNGSRAAAQNAVAPAEPIHARGFILDDAAGFKRGELVLDEHGNPVLKLYDRSGRVRWSNPVDGVIPLVARR